MLTSAATITGTKTSRPGLRARVRQMSRSARLAVLLGLAAGATLATTALPASAATSSHAFNLTGPWQTVAGTDCSVLVGTDMNAPNAWPGTATQVSCASRHKTTSVYSTLDFWSQNAWYYWTTPTYTYSNSYGTNAIYYDFASSAYCIGDTWWMVYSYVYVDGVYRGAYANNSGQPSKWDACTTHS
jgi:hypothetical protein